MAVTYGFYNSINKDRAYNAIQFSQIFDGVINDGIYMSVLNHFMVRSNGGMQVVVGGGRAWFNHTWTYNDSDLLLNIAAPEIEASRIDAIAIKVDTRDTARVNSIEIIRGTPSLSPTKPVMVDDLATFYHPLAYITVPAGATEITDSMIENAIGVDSRTPFVTGIIETISATELIQQWQTEWDEWNSEHRQAYLDWVNQQETDMTNWTDTQQQEYLAWLSAHREAYEEWVAVQETDMETWTSNQKSIFENWFQHLHDELDEHQAAHLQNQIDDINTNIDEKIDELKSDLNEETFKLYHDLCNKNTHIDYSESGDITQITSNSSDYSANSVITFEDTDTGKVITTTVTKDSNRYIQTVVINNQTHDITESYTKEVIT